MSKSGILEIFNKYPILIDMTKDTKQSGIIHYGINFNLDFIKNLSLVYQNYFKKETVIILPKIFSGNPLPFSEAENTVIYADLESLEKFDLKNAVIIFACTEMIFSELFKINRRRINQIIKNLNKKNKIHMLSSVDCKIFEIKHLEKFENVRLKENVFDFSLIDILDSDQETYNENIENLIETIKTLTGRVYMSMDLSQSRLQSIETKLKENGISVSRKEDPSCTVIINSIKTTEKTILIDDYSVYFYIFPMIFDPIELIPLIKDTIGKENIEIYIDSSRNKNFTKNLKSIFTFVSKKLILKDSPEYDTYEATLENVENVENIVVASEEYRYIDASESILQTLNLSNLSKQDNDIIKNYIKMKLIDTVDKFLCHLITPSSPKGSYNFFNSFKNVKGICAFTCEIFTDYTIGIIEWNEMSKNVKGVYIYQTTGNKWKYTSIN